MNKLASAPIPQKQHAIAGKEFYFSAYLYQTMLKYIYSILFLALFASCDCATIVTAYVVDKNDHAPVVHAMIHSIASLDGKSRSQSTVYSDSNGKFRADTYVQGVAKCPVQKLFISKQGYKTETVVQPRTGDTIYLEKLP